MAILYSKIADKLADTTLTEDEASVLLSIERFIDNKIETEFNGIKLLINPDFIPFGSEINGIRRKIMLDELFKRYAIAGWLLTIPSGTYLHIEPLKPQVL